MGYPSSRPHGLYAKYTYWYLVKYAGIENLVTTGHLQTESEESRHKEKKTECTSKTDNTGTFSYLGVGGNLSQIKVFTATDANARKRGFGPRFSNKSQSSPES